MKSNPFLFIWRGGQDFFLEVPDPPFYSLEEGRKETEAFSEFFKVFKEKRVLELSLGSWHFQVIRQKPTFFNAHDCSPEAGAHLIMWISHQRNRSFR